MSASRWIVACLIVVMAPLFICCSAVLAAPVQSEDTGVGPPSALARGQAPPLPKAGPLAEPRSPAQVGFPAALTKSVIPPSSPLKPAVVSLGERLFFENRLSRDGTVACATCHDPARAFTDGRPASIGVDGRSWPAQRTDRLERALQQDAVLGRPGQHARAASGVADHECLRDGVGQHRPTPSPKSPATRNTRRQFHGGFRSHREPAGHAARHCHLRTDAGFVRLSLRSFHRGR